MVDDESSNTSFQCEEVSPLFLQLPIELFEKILSYLDQRFLLESFTAVNRMTHSIVHSELTWRNRVFVIDRTTEQIPLSGVMRALNHVQIKRPNFQLYRAFYHSENLTVLELSSTRIQLSQLASLLFSNQNLVNVSLSQLEVYDLDVALSEEFVKGTLWDNEWSNLDHCVSLRWVHVHFGTVQLSNQVLGAILRKCPQLETVQFATQNCANLDTAKLIFAQPKLCNLSLLGMDELLLDEFFELYTSKPQWNSMNLQSCRGICNQALLQRIARMPQSSSLRELSLRFEPSLMDPLQWMNMYDEALQDSSSSNQTIEALNMCHLQVLRLHNVEPMMTPLITNIVNNCTKSLQILSLNVPQYYEDLSRNRFPLKKAFQFFPGKQYPNLKQVSTSNLPFSVCSQFQGCSPNLEKAVVFGINEKMDNYLKRPPFVWSSLKVLFLENVSFAKTKKLTSLIFSLPNLEILKFAYVFCESNSSKALKFLPIPQETRRTKIVDLEVQDSALTCAFFITLFSASPNLKHLKLSNMESDHIVPSTQRGYARFYDSLSSMCPNLLTLNLEMRACPCLKDLHRVYELPRVQRVSILDIMKLRFDEAFSFILSVTNAQTAQLFIDPTQMMEGSFYFFKDFRSFYEHLLIDKNETMDYFQEHGNFGSFVFQILKERLEYALQGVKFPLGREYRRKELRMAFQDCDTLKQVPCLWQFYLFCGMSLALINPTLKLCCERDLSIHMDQFNWSMEQQ